MLIDYILEAGSEILLLGIQYLPEGLLPRMDDPRYVTNTVLFP
jgi:hypothetical protein